jgi:hypothetical protein
MPRKKVGGGSKKLKVTPAMDVAPGVGRFTLEKILPHLRSELNRRIMAIAEDSADLIGSGREAVIEATLKRFADWITPEANSHPSTPATAGLWSRIKSHLTGRNHPETPIELANMTLEDRWRLVMIGQGHRFTACLNEMLAIDGGAIAMIWRRPSYPEEGQSLEDHRGRDGKVYALRGCWAIERGLIQPGAVGYYDEVTPRGL